MRHLRFVLALLVLPLCLQLNTLAQDANEIARGTVFEDIDGDGSFSEGDKPMADVRVSNGRQIVKTDAGGKYTLPVTDDTTIFVLKPRGYGTKLNEHNNPLFYYTHKPNGSPALQYAAVEPTGPLPTSIDFPLYEQAEPQQFKAIMFGDPQPRNQQEVDYMAHDVVEDLIGTDASFGVTLGDIVYDDLDMFGPQAQVISTLGIPWYNIVGNHDINFDAKNDKQSDETFEKWFGPNYYSFDYGPVHFLVLDDVEWYIKMPGQGAYRGGLGKEQMEFIRNDLALIPDNQLVVIMMHIPLIQVKDREELYRLIEKRPFCMSISAHTHMHEHRYITKEDGWQGPQPHHHIINVTVSGSWWAGAPDERRIPHTQMRDGAPNGYSILHFDGHQYSMEFRAAGRPQDYQMEIVIPESISADQLTTTDAYANVFNASPTANVEFRINGGPWSKMAHTIEIDPLYQAVYDAEMELLNKFDEHQRPWLKLNEPDENDHSKHLWKAKLPGGLSGLSIFEVRAETMDGKTHTDRRFFRVTPAATAVPSKN